MSIAKHRDPSQRIHRPRSATATREQLLDAAIDLFASQGIAATTVAQIARQVGVTSAMIHYYFNTREQLLDAIVTEKIAGIISHVTEPLTVDCDDPVVMVHSILERFADVAEKMPWFPSLWTREIINEGGLLRERMFRHIPVVRLGQLSDHIAAGQEQGSIHADIECLFRFSALSCCLSRWQKSGPKSRF